MLIELREAGIQESDNEDSRLSHTIRPATQSIAIWRRGESRANSRNGICCATLTAKIGLWCGNDSQCRECTAELHVNGDGLSWRTVSLHGLSIEVGSGVNCRFRKQDLQDCCQSVVACVLLVSLYCKYALQARPILAHQDIYNTLASDV